MMPWKWRDGSCHDKRLVCVCMHVQDTGLDCVENKNLFGRASTVEYNYYWGGLMQHGCYRYQNTSTIVSQS